MTRRLAPVGLLFLVGPLAGAAPPAVTPEAAEFFEKKIRPVLVEHCVTCHGPKKEQAGLRLDTRAGLLKGSDFGPVVVPGSPEKSPLLRAVRYEGDLFMPPKGKLPDSVVANLETWIKNGVPWPEAGPAVKAETVAEIRQRHWAFRPVRNSPTPAVRDTARLNNEIDLFVIARLEQQGLHLSPEADPRTLIRRLHYDLIGLPPTPEEVEAFLQSAIRNPQSAIEQLVDRLLASPHYGERWARHWLDVARYADTKGYVFQEERRYPFAYTYRDYVVSAFNEDLPYDQFVMQQLAADRLDLKGDPRPLAAMGFLTLGRRFLNNSHDIIDDRIDVTMRGLQGLTVQCARCHDHKFDPIPARDYYSLYGVFASSQEPQDLPVIEAERATPEGIEYRNKLAQLQKDVDEFRKKHEAELNAKNRQVRNQLRDLQKKVDALKVTHPGAPASAMVLVDAPQPMQPHVFLRGNPNNRGESVPRRFLEIVSGDHREPFTEGSGRLELARAIASRGNPLTARVMVNRVWMHHFGRGLVTTPSDFGLRGDPPSHPELLDRLGWRFMEDGWSLKKLHRLIVLSATYRQRSDDRPEASAIDPENRLLWRMNRTRLDFEAMRDGLLAVTGKLDRTMGGPPVDITKTPSPPRRTIYGFIDRQNLPGLFRTFDLASPDAHTPQRHATTVPQQALFLMNNPFVVDLARTLMRRPDVAALAEPERKIERLYRLLYGRAPEVDEVAPGMRFIEAGPKTVPPSVFGLTPIDAWEQYAQVLLLANEFVFID